MKKIISWLTRPAGMKTVNGTHITENTTSMHRWVSEWKTDKFGRWRCIVSRGRPLQNTISTNTPK